MTLDELKASYGEPTSEMKSGECIDYFYIHNPVEVENRDCNGNSLDYKSIQFFVNEKTSVVVMIKADLGLEYKTSDMYTTYEKEGAEFKVSFPKGCGYTREINKTYYRTKQTDVNGKKVGAVFHTLQQNNLSMAVNIISQERKSYVDSVFKRTYLDAENQFFEGELITKEIVLEDGDTKLAFTLGREGNTLYGESLYFGSDFTVSIPSYYYVFDNGEFDEETIQKCVEMLKEFTLSITRVK